MRTTYKVIKVNGKSKDEHRHIVEKKLGRELEFNEVIHHINGNKKDNRLGNLKMLSRSEHSRIHSKKAEHKTFPCANCGVIVVRRKKFFIWKKKQGQKNIFCSRRCCCEYNINKRYNICTHEYSKQIKEGLKHGLSGYKISKKYNINKKTVYNHINKLNKDQSL